MERNEGKGGQDEIQTIRTQVSGGWGTRDASEETEPAARGSPPTLMLRASKCAPGWDLPKEGMSEGWEDACIPIRPATSPSHRGTPQAQITHSHTQSQLLLDTQHALLKDSL